MAPSTSDTTRPAPEHFPASWAAHLERNVPAYRRLSAAERDQLHRLVLGFLAEKHFEGCGGLNLTDEVRVTIAAQACFLLLNLDARFSKLRSILVYPDTFIPKRVWSLAHQTGRDPSPATLGESWTQGVVILSWTSVLEGAADPEDGSNVVLHEFAHQLDQEDGTANGIPLLRRRSPFRIWAAVLRHEHAALEAAVQRGDDTFLDGYGATNRAEFFAVATESFFERPDELSRQHPAVYEQLRRFYGQDPAGIGPIEVDTTLSAEVGNTDGWGWRFRIQVAAAVAAILALVVAATQLRNPREPWLTSQPGVSVIGRPPPEQCAVRAEDGRILGRAVGILGRDGQVIGYRLQRLGVRNSRRPGSELPLHDVYAAGVDLVACHHLYGRVYAPKS